MPSSPRTCPRTDSGCEYNCIGACNQRQVRVEPDRDIAYVALSREALTGLLAAPMGPLVIMGLEPRGPGYEMLLRAPNLLELHAAADAARRADEAIGRHHAESGDA